MDGRYNLCYLLLYLNFFIATTITADKDYCQSLPHNTTLESIYSTCFHESTIGGKGYLDLSDSSETMIYKFFATKENVLMGIQIFGDARPKIVNFGALKRIGPGGVFGALWIENTRVKKVNAHQLEVIQGLTIRGNRLMEHDTLSYLRLKAHKSMLTNIQEEGECNVLGIMTAFGNCTHINNFILQPYQLIPEKFMPKKIYGCVRIVNITTSRDFLADIDFMDSETIDCRTLDFKQEIMNNPGLCIKNQQPELIFRGIRLQNNGNPMCNMQCNFFMDIAQGGQPWCGKIDDDLIINDMLIQKFNLVEILRNVKIINGIIRIVNITNHTAVEHFNGHINFPELQFVTGGRVFRNTTVIIDNTAHITVTFPKLISIRGGRKAFVVTKRNQGLSFSKKQVLILYAAANGREVIIPDEFIANNTEVHKKMPITRREKEKEDEDDDDKEDTTKKDEDQPEDEDNLGVIIGCSLGGVALCLVIIVGAIVVAIRVSRIKKSKKKYQLKEKNQNGNKSETTNDTDKCIPQIDNTPKAGKSESKEALLKSKLEKTSKKEKKASTPMKNNVTHSKGRRKSTSKTEAPDSDVHLKKSSKAETTNPMKNNHAKKTHSISRLASICK